LSLSQASVSVIVPCRDAEPWLAEALDSALRQSAAPLEVLVVDDRSRDRSAAIARSFGRPVRVVPSNGRGCNAARATGVLESRGEFIAFVDADDVLDPHKHERQLAVLEGAHPCTLVHTGSVNFWPDGSRPEKLRGGTELAAGRCTRVIFESNPVCGASVMLRRELALALGNYDPAMVMAGDYHFSLVASTRCEFVPVLEPLYRIRRHARNSSNDLSRKAWYHWLAQETFRAQCPEAFATLPAESLETFMRQPALRAAREAYWRRDGRDYRALLELALTLAPEDADLRRFWRRRNVPMTFLRLWDRFAQGGRDRKPEVAA
jgi:glycosyltransferase involved in cell wall biosynthesis